MGLAVLMVPSIVTPTSESSPQRGAEATHIPDSSRCTPVPAHAGETDKYTGSLARIPAHDEPAGAVALARAKGGSLDFRNVCSVKQQQRSSPLLCVERLSTHYRTRTGPFSKPQTRVAVDDVSFDLHAGSALGLVGESGCGKTTLARTILRLIPASSGNVVFDGHDWLALPPHALRTLRRRMQVVFQDPGGSLNPRLRVGALLHEPLDVHGHLRGREQRRMHIRDILGRVGLREDDLDRYPRSFSGGQRQRIAIARALVLEPKLVILDEPTSALDVSVQAQIVNLLRDLQRGLSLTYLFISHDLALVRQICDEVAVMRAGRIVEYGRADSVFQSPSHAYTRQLLTAASSG